ncbi:hypothetical protein DID96_25410 [Burkholderia sp. Bp8963]|uniref:hypothetical protein n=1 Tax=Burkholderia sp. Bp8963 TaxID=2184547 RepID=UPI000F593E90|nr:hypothetical protein [Burkholderia sp. Bp8963]RQS65767.1 hypothetical protein DID96_25410 [Burkholderia sp. Bp8963]
MPSVEDRVDRIESELERLQPSLIHRLETLEANAQARPTSRLARFLTWMGPALPSLFGSIVLAVLGYFIKDSVDLALQRQTVQLSYAKEMQAQLDVMAKADADVDTSERAAVLLSLYGEHAITPLLYEMRYGGNRALGAEAGLRALALTDAPSVCRVLPSVIERPTKQFGWEVHMRVIRVLGAAYCTKAEPLLVEYRRLVLDARQGKSVAYFDRIADTPKDDQFQQLSDTLDQNIKILSR